MSEEEAKTQARSAEMMEKAEATADLNQKAKPKAKAKIEDTKDAEVTEDTETE